MVSSREKSQLALNPLRFERQPCALPRYAAASSSILNALRSSFSQMSGMKRYAPREIRLSDAAGILYGSCSENWSCRRSACTVVLAPVLEEQAVVEDGATRVDLRPRLLLGVLPREDDAEGVRVVGVGDVVRLALRADVPLTRPSRSKSMVGTMKKPGSGSATNWKRSTVTP